MEAFLDFVVKGLVDRPDAVTITPTDRNGNTIYELRVHPTDMGKIIGRQGATVNAIRALLLVGSAKKGVRCALEVVDEDGEGREDGEHREGQGEGHTHEGGHSHSHSPSHGPSQGNFRPRFGGGRPGGGGGGFRGGGGRGPRR
ncbi:MAG TPA: KH domain-containing protein [Verrucomicrobiae bacterium]|nr:KH domain-containing protein [Verrucomicrobiae bacterium]